MTELAGGDADGSGLAPEARLRRLRMRCWRRGTKEMDLILGGYFDACAAALSAAELDAFERLIAEEDTALYDWITGRAAPPVGHSAAVGAIRAHHRLA